MTFYKMLKAGNAISIEIGNRNKNFDPAIFWNEPEKNIILVWAPELGIIEHPATAAELNKHFSEMIKQKFIVTINPDQNYINEFISKYKKRF